MINNKSKVKEFINLKRNFIKKFSINGIWYYYLFRIKKKKNNNNK